MALPIVLAGIAAGAAGASLIGVAGLALHNLKHRFKNPPEQTTAIHDGVKRDTGMTKEQLIRVAKQELEIDSEKNVNFAITGSTGTGKSSLVNAIRYIQNGDHEAGAAPVDSVETTGKLITPYPLIDTSIVFWDCQGGDTSSCQSQDYFFRMKLYAFDFILICFSERLREIDWQIANLAVLYDVPLAFVRTKSDDGLRNDLEQEIFKAKKMNPDVKEEDLLPKVKEQFREKLLKNFSEQLKKQPEKTAERLKDVKQFIISSKVILFPSRDQNFNKFEMDENKLIRHISDETDLRRNNCEENHVKL